MDMVKGLSRLTALLETLFTDAEVVGVAHLALLKSIQDQLDAFIQDPLLVDTDTLDAMSLMLALRNRAQDELPAQRYDTIALCLRLIVDSRRREIDIACGPDDDIPAIEQDQPSLDDWSEQPIAVGFY